MTLKNLVKKLKKFDFEKGLLTVIKENELLITATNTQDQLFERGIMSDGKTVGEYKPFTIAVKQQKGQRYDHITLRDTGSFHRSFFLHTDKWPVLFDARDEKTNMLAEKYGENIFGLTKENQAELNEELIDDVQQLLRGALT